MIPARVAKVAICATLAVCASGCGYHIAGRSNELPKSIHVIAVPTFENKTTTFKIEQKLTAATVHEFLAKTTFKVIPDANGGDALLTAKVLNLEVAPLLFQETTTSSTNVAQATAMIVTM